MGIGSGEPDTLEKVSDLDLAESAFCSFTGSTKALIPFY